MTPRPTAATFALLALLLGGGVCGAETALAPACARATADLKVRCHAPAQTYASPRFGRDVPRQTAVAAQSSAAAQSSPSAQASSSTQSADLPALVNRLSALDYPTRTTAARLIRRAPATDAVAALTNAVRSGSDQFVRYRALVLLTVFNDRSTRALMRDLLTDRNDRVREVAYRWFQLNPDPGLIPTLLNALQTEQAEFVRPALVRALGAVSGGDPAVQRALTAEAGRGLDFFRSAVIETLGFVKATWALSTVTEAAGVDGPLQDDALLALGRIGNPASLPALTDVPARPVEAALAAQAARCMLGDDCAARVTAITDAVVSRVAARDAVRSGMSSLAALALTSEPAMTALVSLLSNEAVRVDATLGIGNVALRDPKRILLLIENTPAGPARDALVNALDESFDRFEEDFAEEQFYATARAAYWSAAEGSPTRTLIAALIEVLDF